MKKSAAEQLDPEPRRIDRSDRIVGLIYCVQCFHEIAEIVGDDSNMLHLDFEGMFHPLVIEEAA